MVNEQQLTYFPFFKNSPRVDFFGGLFLATKYCRGFASPLTHTWLFGIEVLTCVSLLVMIERVGERNSLAHCHYPVILASYYRPQTVKCIRVSYFLVTVLRCNAKEQESLKCILSRLERVVVVRPTYALYSLDTLSSKEHVNRYTTLVLSRSSVEGEVLLEIIRSEVLNLL